MNERLDENGAQLTSLLLKQNIKSPYKNTSYNLIEIRVIFT
jgi:hypothetical protein